MDFLHGLFPQMIKDGLPVYAYEDDGYWNDLRDIPSYLNAQRDILEGRVRTELHPADGVLTGGTKPAGSYSITPPVYIGADVRIGAGAQIGPFAVLDDGCHVGHNAKIRGSVLLPSAYAGDRSSMTGALVCHGASVRRGASLFEGVVLGAGSVVGEYASVSPDVRIWPDKKVESNCCQRENLHSGHQQLFQFDENGLTGETGGGAHPRILCAAGRGHRQPGAGGEGRRGMQPRQGGLGHEKWRWYRGSYRPEGWCGTLEPASIPSSIISSISA